MVSPTTRGMIHGTELVWVGQAHINLWTLSTEVLMGPYAHTHTECEHLEKRVEKDLATLYPEQCLALVDAQ